MITSLLLVLCLPLMWGEVSAAPVGRNCEVKNTDVIFVLDTSSSIKDADFQETLRFVTKFVDDTPVIGKTGTQIGIYTFGTGFKNEITLGRYQDKESLKTAIMALQSKGGATDTNLVLDDVRLNGFSARSDARPDVQRAVVVITDGESTDPEMTEVAARKLHKEDIFAFAVGVGTLISKDELATIASTKDSVSYVKDFQALKTIEKKVNQVICDHRKLLCTTKAADVIFVLDSSDSVKDNNFTAYVEFLTNFVKDAEIGSQNIQVGVFLFADDSMLKIRLNEFNDKAKLIEQIRNMKRIHGATYTDKALQDVRTNGFTAENGGRGKNADQIVIVITDGESVLPKETKAAAKALRAMNVEIYAVGIGRVNDEELKDISSGSVTHVRMVDDFKSLSEIEDHLFKKVCSKESVDEGKSTPSSGGDGNTGVSSTTQPKFEPYPKNCQTDLIFVLDTSGSIKDPDFNEMLRFVLKFIDASPMIGKTGTQVGIYTFNTDFRYEIQVGKYQEKETLKSAILSIHRTVGATWTHLVLDDVLKNGFSIQGNVRPDVQRVVVVITDGESEDPQKTKISASALHQANIITFAVGVGRSSGKFELRDIASRDEYVSCVKNFQALDKVEKQINSVICDQKPKLCSTVPLDVVFVLDSSDSVKDTNFKQQIDFVTTFVEHSKFGPKDVQISLFTFADKSNFLIKLNDFKNKNELLQKLKSTQRDHGFTNTDVALNDVRENAFSSVNGGRGSGAKQVVIVLTDGESITPEATKSAADALHSLNVEIFSVGIGSAADVQELHNIASAIQNVRTVPDFKSLKEIEEKMLKKVCVADKTVTTPLPIVCTTTPSDVIFVLDSSDSVKEDDFKKYIRFLTKFVRDAKIGPKETQVGVFLYADDSSLVIRLDELIDEEKLVERIGNMKRIHGGTYTDKALQDVRTHGFTAANGGRGSKANQITIVLTDGESISPDDTKAAAQALRAMNVEIYAIGIGKVNVAELHAISTDVDHVRTVPDFKGLSVIERRLFKEVCTRTSVDGGVTPSTGGTTPSNGGGSTPSNGGETTGDGNTGLSSTIQPNFVCSTVPLDVVFVLDSSDSVKDTNFKQQIDFVTTFVEHSKFGPKDVQISLFTFADKSNFLIKLNDFKNKNELLQKLKSTQRDHGFTNTDVALNDVRENAFSSVNGGRGSGAKQVVIVLTDGESITPEATKSAADALHSLNVEIFSVGIGSAVDVQELHNIASAIQNVRTVPDFKSLKEIEEKMLKKVCVADKTVTTPLPIVCTTTPSDVIFVLDSSDSVKEDDFKKYIRFLTKFVRDAKIGPKETQVGVFLYADDSSLVIRLDELIDEEKLVERIGNMKRIHGGTYTDKALQDVRTHGFTAANGGRGSKANQITIVLTDGESISPDDTKAAAQALRAMNVEIYAIGIGKVNVAELHAISTDVDHVRTVPDFKGLSVIERRLFKEVCTRTSVDGGVTPSTGGNTPSNGGGTTSSNGGGATSSNGGGVTPSNGGGSTPSNGGGSTPSNGGETTGDGNTGLSSTIQPNFECNEESKKMADVVILLDNSDSLSEDFFKEEIMMVNKVIKSHTIGPKDVQVAVITFADNATEVFSLKQAAAQFKRSKGSTNTAGALNLAMNKSFLPSSGARTASHKVIIVVTDGTSDDEFETQLAVRALRATGVNIFVIGIGNPDLFELRNIAGDASRVFMGVDSDVIEMIGDKIFDGKCGPVTPRKKT